MKMQCFIFRLSTHGKFFPNFMHELCYQPGSDLSQIPEKNPSWQSGRRKVENVPNKTCTGCSDSCLSTQKQPESVFSWMMCMMDHNKVRWWSDFYLHAESAELKVRDEWWMEHLPMLWKLRPQVGKGSRKKNERSGILQNQRNGHKIGVRIFSEFKRRLSGNTCEIWVDRNTTMSRKPFWLWAPWGEDRPKKNHARPVLNIAHVPSRSTALRLNNERHTPIDGGWTAITCERPWIASSRKDAECSLQGYVLHW